jgi:hypothetical protein
VDEKLKRLQAAGIAVRTPLGEPHRSVIEEMSEQEVASLISMKRRFDAKADVEAHATESSSPPDEFFAML